MTILIFFRVDHPTLKMIVDCFEDIVTSRDINTIKQKARELDLNLSCELRYGLGYDVCEEGTIRCTELFDDQRFVRKIYGRS